MRAPPLLRPFPIALAVVVLVMGGVGFLPLFDGPGYESSLAAGLVLPFAVAVAVALESSCGAGEPVLVVARGLGLAALLALAAYSTTLVHGAVRGFCDIGSGSLSFAIGPALGALLAGAWGSVAGEIARRRRRRRLIAVALAVALPLASMGLRVADFYRSPMVYAYDPFVGFFSGTLYDTIIDTSGLLRYRAGSTATLLATLAGAALLRRSDAGHLRVRRGPMPELVAGFLLALTCSVGFALAAPSLGYSQTSESIAAALGGRIEGSRCRVSYSRALRLPDIERFAHDCDAHVGQIEHWLGASGPDRINVFVFESAGQKGALMGAADTYIAKPWRRELYVQAAGYPHPVIGHELAHVIAGAFGRGPFRIAGDLGGWLPNPGLVEGLAVAAEPREGDLTPAEWAKAMKDLKLLPQLETLFALGFLAENANVAYTVSGAFVGFIHDTYGADTVRAWYGGAPLPKLTGATWPDLEKRWHAQLDTLPMSDAARAAARARFDHPAVFGRRCPHVIDGCKAKAAQLASASDTRGAIAAYEAVLRLDPHDVGSAIAIAKLRIRMGDVGGGKAAFETIVSNAKASRAQRDRALEELMDEELREGNVLRAAQGYAEIASRTVDEDSLRTLDLKTAAAADARIRPPLVALLIGTIGHAPDRLQAVELLRGWADAPPADGIPYYLLARQYLAAAQYEEAGDRLDRSLAAPIAIRRVAVEAERLRFLVSCALGDVDGARRSLARYVSDPSVSVARRDGAQSLLGRCWPSGPSASAHPN